MTRFEQESPISRCVKPLDFFFLFIKGSFTLNETYVHFNMISVGKSIYLGAREGYHILGEPNTLRPIR